MPRSFCWLLRRTSLLLAASIFATGAFAHARVDTGDARALARAHAFLKRPGLSQARRKLGLDEKLSLGLALSAPGRQLHEDAVAGLLRNPRPWHDRGAQGRDLLRTIVKALPAVVNTPRINHTLKLAASADPAHYRGYGTEIVAAGALSRYRTPSGARARMTRMGAHIRGIDGQMRESDGAVMIGADGIERLVTVKSCSSLKSLNKALAKASDQLAARNPQQNGTRRPGVMVIGYGDNVIYSKLKSRNWQASADRTGAKLLVLAVDQATGRTTKLASFAAKPHARIRPSPHP